MQFMGYKRQIWIFFTFRRYHRILHTCQELNGKEKKPQIYTALFLALHHHTDAYVNLKKKNTMNIRIYRHFFRYKNKSILVFPKKKKDTAENTMYHENIVKKTDVNVSIYVNKHACIWKPWPFHL